MTNMGYNPVQNTQVLVEATAKQQKTALKLTWKSDEPVWTERWPLSREKLQALEQLLSRFSRVRLCATHRRQPTRLARPWDSPGKNTGVGCHFLLQS